MIQTKTRASTYRLAAFLPARSAHLLLSSQEQLSQADHIASNTHTQATDIAFQSLSQEVELHQTTTFEAITSMSSSNNTTMNDPPSTPSKATLLGLPAELRVRIYEALFPRQTMADMW